MIKDLQQIENHLNIYQSFGDKVLTCELEVTRFLTQLLVAEQVATEAWQQVTALSPLDTVHNIEVQTGS